MSHNVRFLNGSMLSCDTQIWLSDKNLLTKTAGQQKPAANPFRNVAQSVRAAGLYPVWRGFESFRSDGFMTIIDFLPMAPVERCVLLLCQFSCGAHGTRKQHLREAAPGCLLWCRWDRILEREVSTSDRKTEDFCR